MNINAINLNLLVALDALLRERSVTRAARRVGVTQPAMSNSLAQLRTLESRRLVDDQEHAKPVIAVGQALSGRAERLDHRRRDRRRFVGVLRRRKAEQHPLADERVIKADPARGPEAPLRCWRFPQDRQAVAKAEHA